MQTLISLDLTIWEVLLRGAWKLTETIEILNNFFRFSKKLLNKKHERLMITKLNTLDNYHLVGCNKQLLSRDFFRQYKILNSFNNVSDPCLFGSEKCCLNFCRYFWWIWHIYSIYRYFLQYHQRQFASFTVISCLYSQYDMPQLSAEQTSS